MTEPFGAGCAAVPTTGKGSFDGMSQDPVATAASNNPALSTLVTAVKAAGLVDTLNTTKDITVFAPTNDAFAAMLGRTADSLVGVRVEDITWPEDREVDRVHLAGHREGAVPAAPVRKRYVGADGRPVEALVDVSLVRAADGRPSGVVAHVRPAPG